MKDWNIRTGILEEANCLSHEIIGAAIEVHKNLGPGFLETVYEEAMAIELTEKGLPFVRQFEVAIDYKNHSVGQSRVDMLIDDILVVEFKVVESLAEIHTAQVLSYLKSLQLPLGLLINFNVPVLRNGIRRVVLTNKPVLKK